MNKSFGLYRCGFIGYSGKHFINLLKILLLLSLMCLVFAEIVISEKIAQYMLRLKPGIMTEAAGQCL